MANISPPSRKVRAIVFLIVKSPHTELKRPIPLFKSGSVGFTGYLPSKVRASVAETLTSQQARNSLVGHISGLMNVRLRL